jgi:phospholipase C
MSSRAALELWTVALLLCQPVDAAASSMVAQQAGSDPVALEYNDADGAPASAKKPSSKIDHFVVVFMENRAFDHILGCLDRPGLDGIPPSGRLLPIDPDNSSKGHANVTCGSADYICPGAPSCNNARNLPVGASLPF